MPDITAVLVAGYPDIDSAQADFEVLIAAVSGRMVAIDGAILVTHDDDGSVAVRQTGDHLGRKGLGWGGGVGLAVGLFAPPLLASVAAGAVAGGVVGKFVDHRLETEMHDKIGENLPPGSAGIIAVFDEEQRLGVQQALGGALRAVRRPERQGGHPGAEGLPRRRDGQVQPGSDGAADPRSELRRHGRTHARRFRAGLDDQHDAFAAGRRAERAARPDRRCGLRQPVDVRRAGVDAGDDAASQSRVFATTASMSTALCSPTRAALLTGRNHHAVGFGSIAEFPARSLATPRACRRTAPRSCGCCRATATRPAASASGI